VTTPPDETPVPGAHYFAPQREENIPKINEAVQYITEVKKLAN
jgi:hypothetical protein